MNVIARILVPVDFSEHSDRAVEYALTIGKQFGAAVELLHVVDDPFRSGGWGSEVYVSDIEGVRQRALDEATTQIEHRRSALEACEVPIMATVRMGHIANTIVEYAAAPGTDLIVMGTHGRTGLAHFIIGSVAERVVRLAPCPVLTVGLKKAARTHAAA